jgi:hypothetical protein
MNCLYDLLIRIFVFLAQILRNPLELLKRGLQLLHNLSG